MSQDFTPQSFRDLVSDLFPDVQAARLARVGNVATRTAQKWIAGETVVPDDVRMWVEHQHAIFRAGPIAEIRRLIDVEMAEMDKEVIAAQLSKLYEELTGVGMR